MRYDWNGKNEKELPFPGHRDMSMYGPGYDWDGHGVRPSDEVLELLRYKHQFPDPGMDSSDKLKLAVSIGSGIAVLGMFVVIYLFLAGMI